MPEFYKAKCKDRYRRIQEYLRRTDHLKNDPNQPILTVKKSKVVKREQKRENRAKQVAQVETAIEKELLERLQKGVYGEIYNLPQKTFDTILGKHGKQQEMNDELIDDEVEYVEEESGIEEESEVEEDSGIEEESEVEYLEEFEMSEEEGLQNITVGIQDLEDLQGSTLRKPSRGKKARVEVEYENEGPTKELSK